MNLVSDFKMACRQRCPLCNEGALFKSDGSMGINDVCGYCGADLSSYDIGDGAVVFMIFILGFLIIPLALIFEYIVSPPLWLHAVIWSIICLGIIFKAMPVIKTYIIILENRHRKSN